MPGKVIRFADYDRKGRDAQIDEARSESAVVIILPVIRVERGPPLRKTKRRRQR